MYVCTYVRIYMLVTRSAMYVCIAEYIADRVHACMYVFMYIFE